MALIKFGGGIVKMSGSLAGNTFARNRSGDYVRSWKKPVNPRTALQETARAIVSYIAEYWHQVLTAGQRAGWEDYAAAVSMSNKLGDAIFLTGFNHFVRTNCHRYKTGFAPLADAPLTFALAEQDPSSAVTEENIAAQTFTISFSTLGWGANADDKKQICWYQGTPQLVSRNTFFGPWRYAGKYVPPDGAVSPATVPASFTFAEGQKVWFRARILLQGGRLSEYWDLAPRTIVADV